MSTNESFAIIGLTGGIASGKSTVSEMFRDRGIRVIDADALAREVVEPGEPALDEIRETFGDEVIADDGSLDRDALGDVIFSDDAARATLNAITHPRIAQRMQTKAREARESGEPWVVYDAALIVENDLQGAFEALIVVAASPEAQRDRLMDRDGIGKREAQSRLDAQMPLAEKVDVADYVIDNDGALEETRRQVDALFELIDRGLETVGSADRETLEDEGLLDTLPFDFEAPGYSRRD